VALLLRTPYIPLDVGHPAAARSHSDRGRADRLYVRELQGARGPRRYRGEDRWGGRPRVGLVRCYEGANGEENEASCGWRDDDGGTLFQKIAQSVFAVAASKTVTAEGERLVIGAPLAAKTKLISEPSPRADSYKRTGPLAGPAGLREAVAAGFLHPAKQKDLDKWKAALLKAGRARALLPARLQNAPLHGRPL